MPRLTVGTSQGMETNMSRSMTFKSLIGTLMLLLCCSCLEEPDGLGLEQSERNSYPGFGTEIDQIIAPLLFVQKNADGEDESFGMEDIFADESNQLLLLTTSSGWCTACKEEQPTLQAMYEQYRARGLLVMVTLFQTQSFGPADSRYAQSWKSRYELTYPVVADTPFVMESYYPDGDASATPLVMLVDVNTMTILYKTTGFQKDAVEGFIDTRLPANLETNEGP